MTRPALPRAALSAVLTTLALTLAACGGSTSTVAPGSAAPAASSAGGATAAGARGPLTLDQCTGEKLDRKATYDTVPQKIFTLDPQSAEFLIALGLGDRIVGTWGKYSDDELAKLPQYAEQLKKIKSYDDGKTWPPPIETIASTAPDIVVTTYRLNIPNYLDATRLEKDTGIDAYSFTTYCTGGVLRSFDPLFTDIGNLGKIFDVTPAADALVTTMKGQLDEAGKLTAGKPRAKVWQYAGEEVPYPVGGTGIPNAIMYLAGADNVFEDVDAVYGEVSWEQVVQRNADVIWLQTDAGPGFVQTEDALKVAVDKHKGLSGVTGVAKKRYVVVPYTTAGTLSVHNAEAVLEFAKKLQEVGSAG
ncbi:MAG: ABC transporter substrate-binding protein [Actinobacteria bacterium]|nr:ABC transporter substrate-binding protein [Actinomycetota bacterium]